jgi:hypothetical protein
VLGAPSCTRTGTHLRLPRPQVIFKHLFQLKYAERQLNTVWAALQPTRGLPRADQERFRPWHTLCRGLTHVLQVRAAAAPRAAPLPSPLALGSAPCVGLPPHHPPLHQPAPPHPPPQEYLRYVTTDVLEPLWLAMEERIARAHDIDEASGQRGPLLCIQLLARLHERPVRARPFPPYPRLTRTTPSRRHTRR